MKIAAHRRCCSLLGCDLLLSSRSAGWDSATTLPDRNSVVPRNCAPPTERRGNSRGSAALRGNLIFPSLLLWLTIASQLMGDDQPAISANFSMVQKSTVRIASGTDLSSGVIVSTSGHVLTVAHGLHNDGDSVTIFFSDGQTAEAEVLLRDTAADVAVLKIATDSEAARFSPLPIAPNTTLENGQLVLAAGYPGREPNGLMPVVRIGELLAVEKLVLRSSCTLTVGDSGGPLINHNGELIGLHRQIGLGNGSNLHLRMDRIRDVVSPVPDLETSAAPVSPETQKSSRLPEPGVAVLKTLQQRSVEIRHNPEVPLPVVLGTLLDSRHVATKLSELLPEEPISCRFHDLTTCTATITGTDTAADLAILTLSQDQTAVAPLALDFNKQRNGTDGIARQIVYASLGIESASRAGIVTRIDHKELPMTGKLGAILETIDLAQAVAVREISPNGTAAKAELAVGDRIWSINGQLITSLDDVTREMLSRQPGDWLRFEYEREKRKLVSVSRLQHDPGERFERTEYLDGRSGQVSDRRSGFENVLQHDIPLAPRECGGPLCDSSGRVIAMTIARRARESSLAVPIDFVLRLAERP